MPVLLFEKHTQRFRACPSATEEVSKRRIATEERVAAAIATRGANADSAKKPGDEEIRQRIGALKARKPVTTLRPDGFHFEPTEPLRLITREKP
jgi:hypothetical protein